MLASLTFVAALAACGGGGGATSDDGAASPSAAVADPAAIAVEAAPVVSDGVSVPVPAFALTAVSLPAAAVDPTEVVSNAAPVVSAGAPAPALAPPSDGGASATVPKQDATPALAPVHNLSTLPATPEFTATAFGATPNCMVGYAVASAALLSRAANLPADGAGVMYSPTDLAIWRARVKTGPFLNANDYTSGSPGDWDRINANAARFLREGESVLTAANEADQRSRHGTLVRDAAFVMLLGGEVAKYLPRIREHLLQNLEDPLNDYTQPCYRKLDGRPAPDVFFAGAHWLAKLLVTYDFARPALSVPDRLRIERAIAKQAHAFAVHLDEGLRTNFPRRTAGDYTVRTRDAATQGEARWFPKVVDADGDCKYSEAELALKHTAYAYVRGDGSLGPRLSYLTQWYNNRRASEAMMVGIAAALLGDSRLAERAKRYFYEWVTYGMAADGSDGEFVRNGNYCIAKQGVIYQQGNLQAALMTARALARVGDRDLLRFSTRDGLNGTEVPANQPAKSMATGIKMQLELSTRKLDWYMHEPQRAVQVPRPETHLGRMESRYLNGARENDNFHELGLLLSAAEFPELPVAAVLMRDRSVTSLRFPGANGNPVWTGTGTWTDGFALMPAVFLLRP